MQSSINGLGKYALPMVLAFAMSAGASSCSPKTHVQKINKAKGRQNGKRCKPNSRRMMKKRFGEVSVPTQNEYMEGYSPEDFPDTYPTFTLAELEN